MNTAIAQNPKTSTTVCSCGHNGRRGPHKKLCQRVLVRRFTVTDPTAANDRTPPPPVPSDYKRVCDALHAGWGRTLSRTLTTGLVRQGLTEERAKAIGLKAVKERWIKPVKGGGWCLGTEN